MTIAEVVYEKLKSARPEVAQEVLDFLEFIEQRRLPAVPPPTPVTPNVPATSWPATSWEASFGALKDTGAFAGDPVAVQRKLRDEWT